MTNCAAGAAFASLLRTEKSGAYRNALASLPRKRNNTEAKLRSANICETNFQKVTTETLK